MMITKGNLQATVWTEMIW